MKSLKSLRVRLVIGFTVLLSAALLAFGTIVWLLARDAMKDDLDDFLRGKAMLLSRLMPYTRLRLEPWMEQDLQLQERHLFVQTFDAEGALVGRSSNAPVPVPLTDAARRSEHPAGGVVFETMVLQGRAYRVATHSRRDRWGEPVVMFAQAAKSLADASAAERHLLTWLVGCGVAMIGAGALWALFFGNQWLRSLSTLEETARAISVGDLGKRRLFVPADDTELAALTVTFNHLLDRLEAAHASQQRFTADASHELRTPLTVLRGEIEVALRRPRSAEEYREVLVSNKEEIERLSRLTENLLALAHIDVGDAMIQSELVNISEVCSVIAEKLQPLAEEKQMILQREDTSTEPMSVLGDRMALERILHNLVENALRHSPSQESVLVRVGKAGQQIQIEVIDSGCGIAPEHLPHLFERFYRADKARSRAQGGSGLGLSIVKALVEAHGGTVTVRSEIGRGSTFTVLLPAASGAE